MASPINLIDPKDMILDMAVYDPVSKNATAHVDNTKFDNALKTPSTGASTGASTVVPGGPPSGVKITKAAADTATVAIDDALKDNDDSGAKKDADLPAQITRLKDALTAAKGVLSAVKGGKRRSKKGTKKVAKKGSKKRSAKKSGGNNSNQKGGGALASTPFGAEQRINVPPSNGLFPNVQKITGGSGCSLSANSQMGGRRRRKGGDKDNQHGGDLAHSEYKGGKRRTKGKRGSAKK
jgi:hypothetical protein